MKLKVNKELEMTILVFVLFLFLITTILNYKLPGIFAIFILLSVIIYKFTDTEKIVFKS
jgi:hypothetical protein